MDARSATEKLHQKLNATRQMLPAGSARSHEPLEFSEVRAAPVGTELARVRRELDKVYASLSWRVTTPLRFARRLLPRRPQRGMSSQPDAG